MTGNKIKKNTVKLLLAFLSSKIKYSLNINGKMRLHLEKGNVDLMGLTLLQLEMNQ
jgi:hypothetical protein